MEWPTVEWPTVEWPTVEWPTVGRAGHPHPEFVSTGEARHVAVRAGRGHERACAAGGVDLVAEVVQVGRGVGSTEGLGLIVDWCWLGMAHGGNGPRWEEPDTLVVLRVIVKFISTGLS